jgi:hypothetical protein
VSDVLSTARHSGRSAVRRTTTAGRSSVWSATRCTTISGRASRHSRCATTAAKPGRAAGSTEATTTTRGTWKRRRVVALEHHRAALFCRHCTADAGLIDALPHDVHAALVDEANDERAALDHIGVTECLLLNARVVDVGAVRAAEVFDDEATVLVSELRVPARDHAVIGSDRALETAADVDGLGR